MKNVNFILMFVVFLLLKQWFSNGVELLPKEEFHDIREGICGFNTFASSTKFGLTLYGMKYSFAR